jgi:hypothetical protein
MDRDNIRLSLLPAQSLTYHNREPLSPLLRAQMLTASGNHALRLHDNSKGRDIIPEFTSAHAVLFPVCCEDGEQWSIGSMSCVQAKA